MRFVRASALLLWKDVVVELRAKELLYGTVFFGAILVLVFSFAFYGGERPPADVLAGVLWVTVALAGTLGIGRAFEREREGNTLRAVLLAPISRPSIYISKLITIALLMASVEIVVALLCGSFTVVRQLGIRSRQNAVLLSNSIQSVEPGWLKKRIFPESYAKPIWEIESAT